MAATRPDPSDRPAVGIVAAAEALPEAVVSTAELQQQIADASGLALRPGTLQTATGIRSRRIARDDEYASTLAVRAGRAALAQAGPGDVDLLLFASATRDVVEPATAHIVQAGLGTRAHCLDVTNACTSFVNGIDLAAAMISAGRARRALVVTGETPTRSMRRQVSGPAQLRESVAGFTFGDGGAAVVLEPVARGGILHVDAEAHSEHWEVGGIPGGGSRHPRGDEHTWFTGSGTQLRQVFEAVGPAILQRTLAATGLGWDDVARVLVHQVTGPYLQRFLEVSGVPADKLEPIVGELGNLASAGLGVQLARVFPQLAPGEKVLLVGLGGGISLTTMVWEKS
ncbi:3-oxoacyl-ACP synthase III family protein [Modestobacter sp. Leaf380]|uniref:3-oxoacyl-ACP synthase III family protein n=1 Tax=Modestobacter sp. Leaf380 TaxID=1736356 RepID=UPI0009E9FA18|nr:ketoacyl-ACP synthase III [Modestobacter sp. Leaf380]